ncbi:hypothetical protein PFISCL1PPCAC_24924 [Pristionchus fissidentatus]|uniref:Uncharacterized protein n=1 Tax=Pristionchus fissidentatus TaxID=1538716 RepID=A0AAV5WV45_9BILA|nr:hypothetical protein PFISCL1PPCAC_24924 [Pristionchus fissidentatus]
MDRYGKSEVGKKSKKRESAADFYANLEREEEADRIRKRAETEQRRLREEFERQAFDEARRKEEEDERKYRQWLAEEQRKREEEERVRRYLGGRKYIFFR